jgi:hypothetical protein
VAAVESSPGLVTLDDVREWLEEGVDNPEKLEHVRFTILGVEEAKGRITALRATSASIPVKLLAIDLGDSPIPAIRVVVETDVDTADLEPREKLKVYRALLGFSKMPLAKIYLYGDDHKIALAVDLDKRSLSKGEFNDAVAALILGYLGLVERLGLEEEAYKEAMRNLVLLAAAQMRSGKDPREIEEALRSAGVPGEIVETIMSVIQRSGEEAGGTSSMYM